MRFSQIRAFHYVATHGGFSSAARALSVSQPAISELVRQLEADHDVLLFNRDKKRVRLTPAGARLLTHTNRLFDVHGQIAEVLSESRAALDGRLRIVADSAYHLTDRITAFRRLHPNVSIHLRTGNTADILSALRTYQAEIGVVGSVRPGRDMEVRDLGASPIVAVAAAGYITPTPPGLTLAACAQYPLILREDGSKTRQLVQDEAARQGLRLTAAVKAEGREAMREVAAAGAGIGFVSEAEFGFDTRLVKIPLIGTTLRMEEALVCLTQRREVRAIRAFMDLHS